MNVLDSISSLPIRVDIAPRSTERAAPAQQAPAAAPPRQDRVDLSDQARLLDSLKGGSDVRTDLVARVKADLASGTYDVDGKLDKALDALIDDVLA